MKKLLSGVVLAVSLALASCATDPNLVAEQTLTAAHVAHDAAVVTVTEGYNKGLIQPSQATIYRHDLDEAKKLLDDADGLSNPADIQADVGAAMALINDTKGSK